MKKIKVISSFILLLAVLFTSVDWSFLHLKAEEETTIASTEQKSTEELETLVSESEITESEMSTEESIPSVTNSDSVKEPDEALLESESAKKSEDMISEPYSIEEISPNFIEASGQVADDVTAVPNESQVSPYAILYSDGTLIIQTGSEPDPSLGEVLATTKITSNKLVPDAYKASVFFVRVNGPVKIPQADRLFLNYSSLQSADLTGLDISECTSLSSLFYQCKNLETVQLDSLDTSHIKTMDHLFFYCEKLNLDHLNFDMSQVTDVSYMFYFCRNLTSLDLRNWDTSKIQTMNYMFRNCSNLSTLHCNTWVTSSVTSMTSMFSYCAKLQTFEGSGWDVSKVSSMDYLFSACSSLTSLDLSAWDVSNVWTTESMFYWCENLGTLDLSSWKFTRLYRADSMFRGMRKLVSIQLFALPSCCEFTESMFSSCEKIETLDLTSWNTSGMRFCSYWFADCHALREIKGIESLNTSAAIYCNGVFRDCRSLTALDLSRWDTDQFQRVSSMFSGCSKLVELDLSDWNLSQCKEKATVFKNTPNLSKLSLSNGYFSTVLSDEVFKTSWKCLETNQVYDNFAASYTADTTGTFIRQIPITFNPIFYPEFTMNTWYSQPVIKLPDCLEMSNYHFLGWFTEKDGGVQIHDGDVLTQSTYYAHYSEYQYQIILKPNGGTGEDTVYDVRYSEKLELPGPIYTREGKVLIGWNTRSNGTGTFYPVYEYVSKLSSIDQSTVILYAQYEDSDEMLTLTFDSNGGIEILPMTVPSGFQWCDLPEPYKKASQFECWVLLKENGEEEWHGKYSNEPVKSGHYVAQWKTGSVVTCDPQDETISVKTFSGYQAEEIANYIPVQHNPHKRFLGWFKESGQKINKYTYYSYDTTLYAHWGWQPCFDGNGGHITLPRFSISDNSSYVISKLPEVSYNGYFFDGWYQGETRLENGCTVDLSNGVPIVAHWTPMERETVTVTFDPNGGKIYKGYSDDSSDTTAKPVTYTFYKGATLAASPRPAISYVHLIGWADADGCFYDENSIISSDITLYAKWNRQDGLVSLIFDSQGGSSATGCNGENMTKGTVEVSKGEPLNSLPGSKKTNYVLDGWYTEPNGVGEKLTTETVIQDAGTWYANWTPLYQPLSDGDKELYHWGAEWSNASDSTVTNVNGHLDFHPKYNYTETASLHLRFELNQTIATSNTFVLPVGSVQIRIPKYVWKNWDGKDTGTNNLSVNLPKWPNTRAGMWFSYREEGDAYVILNSKEISGTAGLDLTVGYSAKPWDIPGGMMAPDGTYLSGYPFFEGTVPVMFSIDENLDGEFESENQKILSLEMHTYTDQRQQKNAPTQIRYEWDTDWGNRPDDWDQYFYLRWGFTYTASSFSQPIVRATIEESGIHDGTVVHVGLYEVITQHPKELLIDIPETGLTLENTAYVITSAKSGYTYRDLTHAKYTIYPYRLPHGEYRKGNRGFDRGEYWLSGTQDDLIEGSKISDTWIYKYNGGSNEAPIWDETSNTYVISERTISVRDGVPGDVLYSSANATKPYLWEPDTGNTALTDGDYRFRNLKITLTDSDPVVEDGRIIGTIPSTVDSELLLYVRHAYSNEWVFDRAIKYEKNLNVTFSDSDIVGFDLRYLTDSAYTELEINSTMDFLPSTHIKMLIQDDLDANAESIFKNSSECRIWNTKKGESSIFFHVRDNMDGTESAANNAYCAKKKTSSQYVQKTGGGSDTVIVDVDRGVQAVPMAIGAVNHTTDKRSKKMRSGVFYDLLPKGTSVDLSTFYGLPVTENINVLPLAGTYETNKQYACDPGWWNVSFDKNWEGSGQTMMIITWSIPDTYELTTGMQFFYQLSTTYTDIMKYGTSRENDVAFVDTTKDRVPPTTRSTNLGTLAGKALYTNLDRRYHDSIGYAAATASYVPIDAYSWGFDKSVQTNASFTYQDDVLLNELYTYKLTYSQSEYSTSQDIVFYDVLEGGSTTKAADGTAVFHASEWFGNLEYVTVPDLPLTDGSTTVRCEPVIYYSSKSRDAFTDADRDLTSDTWSVEKPETVTAVAVDCSKNSDGTDFVMKGEMNLSVYFTMRAPKDAALSDKTAYNEGTVWVRHESDDVQTPQTDNAAVTLRDVVPELHKESSPASGDSVYPNNELSYTLTVSNPSAFTVHDIVVEDSVPDGLLIDWNMVQVYFEDEEQAVSVFSSPRVSLKSQGQTLMFTISSLLSGETVHLKIPTTVSLEKGTFTNTANITKINGVEKQVTSETTTHTVSPAEFRIKKTGVLGLGVRGAKLQLLKDGTVIKEWVSNGEVQQIQVPVGTYTLHEEEAPEGFLRAEDRTVTLYTDNRMEVSGKPADTIKLEDPWTKVAIAKTNFMGDYLPGATLALYEGDNLVERWVSSDQARVFLGKLSAGKTYRLVEEHAPESYELADPITFTVALDGSEQTISMVDYQHRTEVSILKVDENNQPLPFAYFDLYRIASNESENLVESWVSDAESKQLVLDVGDYRLSEIASPSGYEQGEDLFFSISENGKILIDGEEVGHEILYQNKRIWHTIHVSKEVLHRAPVDEFAFTVQFMGSDGQMLTENGPVTIPKNEVYPFTLRDGETVTFQAPEDCRFEIIETEYENCNTYWHDGWNYHNSSEAYLWLYYDQDITFVNEFPMTAMPGTGQRGFVFLLGIGCIAILIGGLSYCCLKRNYHK